MTEENTVPEENLPEENLTEESPAEEILPDVPPDHMSVDPLSKHFDENALKRGVGIRFNGKDRKTVMEYSISEGWVKMQAGKSLDRNGRPLLVKTRGIVEAWFEDLGENPPIASKE